MRGNINLKISFGVILILLLLFFSFFPDLIVSRETAPPILFDEEGEFIARTPYSPAEYPPMGTNEAGESLLFNILVGAKYTIVFVSVVCLLRFVMAFAVAMYYAFHVHKLKDLWKRTIEIAYIIPPVIVVFFMLAPMLGLFQEESFHFMILLMAVLIVIGVPPLALLIGDEIKSELNKDFIKIAKLQGVNNWYIFKKHIWRNIKARMGIFFIQNNIQLLSLLIHLGILGIFIGGSRIINITEEDSKVLPISNEWGGLIGSSYQDFLHHPWIVLAPLFSFMVLIFFLKVIVAGMEDLTKIKHPK